MDAERLDAPERGERAVEIADQRSLGDFEFEPVRRKTGFELVDYSIQFRGTCPDCLKKGQGPEAETPRTRS